MTDFFSQKTEMSSEKLKVCYFGTFRKEYGRNQILINGLRANNIEVIECHQPLWTGVEDRVEKASGGWLNPRFIKRLFSVYLKLIRAHRMIGDYDVMMLGYPGQLDAYIGRWLSWKRGKPMVIDLYMSLYLIATERGLTKRHPLTGKIIWLLEYIGLRLCDLIICDTIDYRAYHMKTFGLPSDRFSLVPAGADDRLFSPRIIEEKSADSTFHVVYHGSFLPSHGIETIIDAAELLKEHSDIRFLFYGTGPELDRIQQLAQKKMLGNCVFSGWVDREEMPAALAGADIALGVFGTTIQSQVTIQNKIWESLMMGKAVITGDSPTVREKITHSESGFLVPREAAAELSRAILTLKNDNNLRVLLGKNGRILAQSHGLAGLGKALANYLYALKSAQRHG